MKKRLVWIAAIVILVLLVTRSFFNHVDNVEKEREWYIQQLDFDFSGVIDTIIPPGRVLFHVTNGILNRDRERHLHEKLRYNGMLDLFLYQPNDQVELIIPHSDQLRSGDSVYVNTDQRIVKILRGEKLLVEVDLIESMRGRPF